MSFDWSEYLILAQELTNTSINVTIQDPSPPAVALPCCVVRGQPQAAHEPHNKHACEAPQALRSQEGVT